LTPMEERIVKEYLLGRKTRSIARDLHMSQGAVRQQLKRMYDKLGLVGMPPGEARKALLSMYGDKVRCSHCEGKGYQEVKYIARGNDGQERN